MIQRRWLIPLVVLLLAALACGGPSVRNRNTNDNDNGGAITNGNESNENDNNANENQGGGLGHPTEPASTGGDVLYQDDFSDDSTGWYTASDSGVVQEYRDGEYVISIDKKKWYAWGGPTVDDVNNVHIAVTARNLGAAADSSYGIICNLQGTDNYNYLAAGSDGYYAIKHVENGDETLLVGNGNEWPQSDAIELNADEYRLEADCGSDGTLRLTVNGEVIDEVTDTFTDGGGFALIAFTFDQSPTEVHFDDFVVTSLD